MTTAFFSTPGTSYNRSTVMHQDVARPSKVMHQDVARPSTPSFRIVSSPSAMNPSPTFTDAFEEEEMLFEDVLSPKKLRQLSGVYDLSLVVTLDLVVDTTESSLGTFGNYLPNLQELRLTGSKITSVRDLGTSLHALQILWMSRCGLVDLDGIGSIGQLKELYLAYNEIADVSPLSMIDTLQLIDLESNALETLDQVEFLCMCPALNSLSLDGNPLVSTMGPVELRSEVQRILPQLKYLDDLPLDSSAGGGGSLSTTSHRLLGNTGSLLSEMQAVSLSLKETVAGVDRSMAVIRPSSAASDRSLSPGPGAAPDHSSGLTHGTILCGPPSKQLRRKVSRDTKETIESVDSQWGAPPRPVGAWAEEPAEMLAEWRESREWLTRELTIDSLNEEKTRSEKQANYEAALRELSRPTTAQRRISSSASSRPPSSSASSRLSQHFDEAVHVEEERRQERRERQERLERRERRERRERGVDEGSGRRSTERGSDSGKIRRESVERRTEKRSSSSTRRSPEGSAAEQGAKPRDRSKRREGSRERVRDSNPEGGFSGKGKYRVVTVDEQVAKSLDSGLKPVRPQIRAPDGPGGMSTRFRKIRASIEDTVIQQSTIDRLYNNRMPKQGLSRHVSAKPGV